MTHESEANENEVLIRTLKAGFKALLVVLMQIRDGDKGAPKPTVPSEASKLFTQFYGE
jgi:hypothetical protein